MEKANGSSQRMKRVKEGGKGGVKNIKKEKRKRKAFRGEKKKKGEGLFFCLLDGVRAEVVMYRQVAVCMHKADRVLLGVKLDV